MLAPLSLFVLSLVSSSVSAGPHAFHQHSNGIRTVHHRRHHTRHLTPGEVSEKRDVQGCVVPNSQSCTVGEWQCVGTELQRCYNDQWNHVQNCTGADVVCSDNPVAIGCVWSWSVPDGGSSTNTTSPGSSFLSPGQNSTETNATSTATSSSPAASASDKHGHGHGHGWQPSSSVSLISTTTSASGSLPTNGTLTNGTIPLGNGTQTNTTIPISTNTTTPLPTNTTSPSNTTFDVASITAPHFVVYADNWLTVMPTATDLAGYNRFVLAFWMVGTGAVDNAVAWEWFDEEYRQAVIEEYHAAGIALMVSAFGSTDTPTTQGYAAKDVAQDLAAWVIKYGLDGVDIDYEDFEAFNAGKSEEWISDLQTELRALLPRDRYLISHAPVAPWFTDANIYQHGGYIAINANVGSTIDWYNIQFYNQGDEAYNTCDRLVNTSGGDWPHTSVMELNAHAGVEMDKIVIGKPMTADAADNGYMSSDVLEDCVAMARGEGWGAGVMFWEWPNNMEIQSLIF